MTYASDFPRPVGASVLEHTAANRTSRREHNVNVGYVLFAFGALWVMAITAAMAVAPTSLPNCQLTVLGGTAMCLPSAPTTLAGLDLSAIGVPAGLTGSGYDAL